MDEELQQLIEQMRKLAEQEEKEETVNQLNLSEE